MYGLKYYIEFTEPDGNAYRTEIFERDYAGAVTELESPADPVTFQAPDLSIMEPLKGSSISVKLMASIDRDLSDLYSDTEKKYYVIHKQDDTVLFKGYMIPDEIDQSFVYNEWPVEFLCIDGIGLLKDLAFVDENGLFFNGLMNVKDIIFYCLQRIGLPEMDFYTSVNTYFDESDLDLDSLAQTLLNTERFVKDAQGENTPMNCEEVLRSTLNIFGACIVQYRGEWYVYKPNELFFNYDNVSFFKYNGTTGEPYPDLAIRNFSVNIGSQINDAYPFHQGENQRINMQKAYKIFRVNYKYGLLSALTINPNFRNWTGGEPEGWEVTGSPIILEHPRGLMFADDANIFQYVMNQQPLDLDAGAVVTIEITNGGLASRSRGYFQVKAGTHYLQPDLTWGADNLAVLATELAGVNSTAFTSITTPPLPEDASLELHLLGGQFIEGGIYALYERVKIIPVKASTLPGLGEFHTVEQVYDYSFVPENLIVYNGDNEDQTDVYVGSIYKAPGEFTSNWVRKYTADEPKPLLRIMAEDYMRMYQRQYRKFTGGFLGFFDYLSVISISGLPGLYMVGGMSFNYASNTGSLTLLEINNEEVPRYDPDEEDGLPLTLPGTIYTITDDYGTPIKPLIR